MRTINPEHIEAIKALVNPSPYYQLLSMKLCDIQPGRARVETVLERKHLNPFGGIHGGANASFIDTAAYWAVYCGLPEDVGLTTVDLQVNNLATVREGKIIAESTAIKVGRSLCLSEVTLTTDGGKLLAHGVSKLMVLQGRQTPRHLSEQAGLPHLPPKFLD